MNKEEAERCCELADRFNLSATCNNNFWGGNNAFYVLIINRLDDSHMLDFSGVHSFFNVNELIKFLVELNKITEEEAILYRLSI